MKEKGTVMSDEAKQAALDDYVIITQLFFVFHYSTPLTSKVNSFYLLKNFFFSSVKQLRQKTLFKF